MVWPTPIAPGTVLFFTDTATTEFYTLSLHDALPIFGVDLWDINSDSSGFPVRFEGIVKQDGKRDRKSTRLNSSHLGISYAVFCLKKKKAPPLRDFMCSGREIPKPAATGSWVRSRTAR